MAVALGEAERFGQTDPRYVSTLLEGRSVLPREDLRRRLTNIVGVLDRDLGTGNLAAVPLLNALAETYYSFSPGERGSQEALYRHALARLEQGGQPPEYAADLITALSGIAQDHISGDRWADAEQILLRALDVAGKSATIEERTRGDLWERLGLVYEKTGRQADRAEALKQAVAAMRSDPEDQDYSLHSATNGLADAYRKLSRDKDAEQAWLDALKMVEAHNFPFWDDYETVAGLGLLYEQQRRYAEAEPLLVWAIDNYRQTHEIDLGEDYRFEEEADLADALEAHGRQLRATQNSALATKEFERAAAIRKGVAARALAPAPTRRPTEPVPATPTPFPPPGPPATVRASPTPARLSRPDNLPSGRVTRVVDGDTVEVALPEGQFKVRLLGMGTPETVDPRTTVQCFGREASAHAKEVLDGQIVWLEADPTQDDRDKYGRLLRYAWLPTGRLFNLDMIAESFAHEYTYHLPYRYQTLFRGAQSDARANGRGLWAATTCNGDTRRAADANPDTAPSGAKPGSTSRGVPPASRNTCPTTHPIKGNVNSGQERIYHVVGGAFYAATNPEECFSAESDAIAAGYRRSQR